jgi:hypothetical protein
MEPSLDEKTLWMDGVADESDELKRGKGVDLGHNSDAIRPDTCQRKKSKKVRRSVSSILPSVDTILSRDSVVDSEAALRRSAKLGSCRDV